MDTTGRTASTPIVEAAMDLAAPLGIGLAQVLDGLSQKYEFRTVVAVLAGNLHAPLIIDCFSHDMPLRLDEALAFTKRVIDVLFAYGTHYNVNRLLLRDMRRDIVDIAKTAYFRGQEDYFRAPRPTNRHRIRDHCSPTLNIGEKVFDHGDGPPVVRLPGRPVVNLPNRRVSREGGENVSAH